MHIGKELLVTIGLYHFQYLIQYPHIIEGKIDKAEGMTCRGYHFVYAIFSWPNADGNAWGIRLRHEGVEGSKMGIRARLHFYQENL